MRLTCDENCIKRSGHHAAIEKLLIVLGGIQLQLRLGQLLGHVPTFSWPVLFREVPELQKRADLADQSVLFFLAGANFWEKNAKNCAIMSMSLITYAIAH